MSETSSPIAFVTGTSSGLGRGFVTALIEDGWRVYGCSRRDTDLPGLRHVRCDLTDYGRLLPVLTNLLDEAPGLDLVILNAGVLGRIGFLAEMSMDEAKAVMEVNLWANKAVMDWLSRWGRPVRQVIMISSGASRLGNKGWGAYSLSKAALNMLARLYAHEFPRTHVSAVAPGIVDTPMMDYLCEEADAEAFPALQRLRAARGTEAMPDPDTAARRVLALRERIRTDYPSGAFVDIREILDPEGYARLYDERR